MVGGQPGEGQKASLGGEVTVQLSLSSSSKVPSPTDVVLMVM